MNKYYPPEWEPGHGSINRFVRSKGTQRASVLSGSAAASASTRSYSQEDKTKRIRFELPMPVWCGGCNRHIAKNVRFNADKRRTGWYHTTPILQFAFKCPSCPQLIVVESAPERTSYRVVSGAKEKTECWDDGGDVDVALGELQDGPQDDGPFAQLERTKDKERRAEAAKPQLEQLEASSRQYQNDFGISRELRRRFREKKKQEEREKKYGDPLGQALERYGLRSEKKTRMKNIDAKQEFQWN